MSFDAEELLQRVQDGDRQAEHELVSRFQMGVELLLRSKVASPIDREDISQEIFLALLKKARGGGIQEPHKLKGFIRSLSLNMIADFYRRRYKRERIVGQPANLQSGNTPFIDPLVEEDATRAMYRLLNELPVPRDREILIRYYYSEEEKEVICADLNLTIRHFHRVIGRARSRFRHLIEEKKEIFAGENRVGSQAQVVAAGIHRFAEGTKKTDNEVR